LFVSFRTWARPVPALACLLGLAGAALAVPAVPAFAAGGADVTVTLVHDPTTLRAGARVSYRVTVRNAGPETAAKVSIDFITTAALTSPTWTVSTGRCLRSPSETACLFGTLKTGGSAWATISGILPKRLPPGTQIKNTVTLTSDTALVDPAHAVANADYTMPGGASPSPSPPAASSAPPSPAAQAAPPSDTHDRPLWTAVALGGFALGAVALGLALTLWLRSRRQLGH
jgi:uncharacterized repeat protein (TIGR01451 family)